MVKTWARHKTTEALLNSGWRLAAVDSWRLMVVGGWRLVDGGPCPSGLSFTKKKTGFLRTALPQWEGIGEPLQRGMPQRCQTADACRDPSRRCDSTAPGCGSLPAVGGAPPPALAHAQASPVRSPCHDHKWNRRHSRPSQAMA